MTGKRRYDRTAEASRALKRDLRLRWPQTGWIVTSRDGLNCSEITIRYTDGPASQAVQRVARPYATAHFVGMLDQWQPVNGDRSMPLVDVEIEREISADATKRVVAEIKRRCGIDWTPDGEWLIGGRYVFARGLLHATADSMDLG